MSKALSGAMALIGASCLLPGNIARAGSVASQNEISSVLVAAEVCGLRYNSKAVRALTRENTNADDQASESVRGLLTVGGRAQYEKLSAPEKREFCAHQTQAAKRLGLLK